MECKYEIERKKYLEDKFHMKKLHLIGAIPEREYEQDLAEFLAEKNNEAAELSGMKLATGKIIWNGKVSNLWFDVRF